MFDGTIFLIVTSQELPSGSDEVALIESKLSENGGKVVTRAADEGLREMREAKFTHVICRTISFPQYALIRSSMIPVTSPEWVLDSIEQQRCLNPKSYSPDASCILKDCFVCVADNLPAGDKEAIYDTVRAFGGSHLDVLTRYTTHLIAVDLSSEKSIIAASVAASPSPNSVDIKIVLPRWLDDCLAYGEKIDETPYILPCMNMPTESEGTPQSDLLQDKVVYISSDYNLSERHRSTIQRLLKKSHGRVALSFDASVNVYVGKYRQGPSYVSACADVNIVVGNLQWLLQVVATQTWCLPIDSNLLHYPVPCEPLEAFKNLKISVTNYSGDARAYLAQLITSLGGEFTKTLTRDNDFLVAAAPIGRKYDTAKFKWLNEDNSPIVTIVNHTWLENCYAQWSMLDLHSPEFQCAERSSTPLAATKLDSLVLRKWWLLSSQLGHEKLEPTNIADSMSEDESTQSKGGPNDLIQIEHHTAEREIPHQIAYNEMHDVPGRFHDDDDTRMASESHVDHDNKENESNNAGAPCTSKTKIENDKKEKDSGNEHLTNEYTDLPEESPSPEDATAMRRRYGGRLAAMRAALKLHEDISDLNEFKDSLKSARKMQSYMEKVQGEVTNKRKTPSPSNTPTKRAKSANKSADSGQSTPFDICAIITGCENIILPSKRDLARLASIGISVVSEILSTSTFDTVIAPKVMRTEKFLRSLSTVSRILHPSFLVDVLKGMESSADLCADYNPLDYMLNKVVPASEINAELGLLGDSDALSEILNSSLKGKLFNKVSVNLSANLNGGPSTIGRILADHGATKCISIKAGLSAAALKKALAETKRLPVLYVLVAHKTKDTKLIANFKNGIENGAVVDWDWCVKSIFKMKLEPLDAYSL